VTQFPEPDVGLDAQLDRLLEPSSTPQARGTEDLPRLAALLAAAAAPCEAGPQPGEASVLAAFREQVVEAAGTPSLAMRRHRRRMAVVAATSTVVMLGSGIAAAATGSLPGAAQSTAKTVLGVIGVSVPGPDDHAGTHPNGRGRSGDSNGPATPPSEPASPDVTRPSHPTTPAGLGQLPSHGAAPGNSGVSRHHGNPTPTATAQPTPGHGKPTAAPTVAHRRGASAAHTPSSSSVMQRYRPAISR
jgi:hypothetical protein